MKATIPISGVLSVVIAIHAKKFLQVQGLGIAGQLLRVRVPLAWAAPWETYTGLRQMPTALSVEGWRLVIHPKYQDRGIGTKLLMVRVVEAQRLKLPAWVEASPAGQKVNKRYGLRDAERLGLDFAKYGFKGLMHIYCMLIDDVNK
jgi:GNAT superfamily N-acetyltransferase